MLRITTSWLDRWTRQLKCSLPVRRPARQGEKPWPCTHRPALNCSLLLTFALADTEEDRKNFARCHEIYEALLNRLNPEIEVLKKQVAVEVETARGPEIFQKPGDDTDMTGDGMSEVQKLIEEREARGRIVAERRGKDVADLAAAAGVVWVMYMRFARRAEVSRLSL